MITSEVEAVRGWISGRLPEGLFEELVEVAVDREEITVVGRIPVPTVASETSEAEHRFERKVSWGVQCEGRRFLFTNVSAPVMTRLRQPERQVLDLLIDGGVARSRSEALAWCVRLVQRNSEEWLRDLQESLAHVRQVREQGPDVA
jgi:hypothetical protein